MKDELQDYINRPKRYDNIDGTGEMLMGLMLLAFALASFLGAILPDNRWWNGIGGVLVIYGVLIPVLGLGYWGRWVIKKRITWPRTGYAAYPRRGKSRWNTMVITSLVALVFTVGLVLLIGFARRHHLMSLPRAGMFILWVVMYALWVFRMNQNHPWKWLVLFFMALGLLTIAVFIPGDFHQFGQSMLLLVGVAWLISGAGTLFSYIRHTKPATPEAE